MRWLGLTIIFAASLCVARSHCSDPRMQNPRIGGKVIIGYVGSHQKPLQFAKVKLYSSSGKPVWVGTTDKDGMFATGEMTPDGYRIEIDGWGSGNVRLDPDFGKNVGIVEQHWWLILDDHGCIGVGANGN